MRKSIFLALLLTCAAANAAPELPQAQRDAIEADIRAGVLRDVAVGYVVGAEHAEFFFGKASADSRFEIGALSEVFTGVLLAQAAYEGKARLHSTLHERLPGQVFCDADLAGTTLADLATHRARLPNAPPNLMPDNGDDLYASYGEADLRAFFSGYRAPARPTGYSPLDFGVLGYALGQVYGAGYAAALREKVLLPLKLEHTGLDDDGVFAGGSRGGAAPRWHFGALGGSAGLRANVGDVVQFLRVNLRPESSPLRAALLLARQAQTESSALGWNISTATNAEQPWPVLWRASNTAGFGAFMGFRTDLQQAVVLLADTDADLSAIGMSLLDGRAVPAPSPAREPAPSSVLASDYVGLYQVRGGAEFVVREGERGLALQMRGDPALPLAATADDVFDAGVDAMTIAFQREARKVTGFVLSRGGFNVLATRLTERAPRLARPSIPTDAKTAAQASGDYRLSNDTLVRLTSHDATLAMQVTGRKAVPLAAFAQDRFACADESCEISLRRADGGAVTALELDFAGGQRVAERAACEKP